MEDLCQSCDTFVMFSSDKRVVFGKNSDRPQGECQEVVFVPEHHHNPGESLQCTFISIPQVSHVLAVILSKPAWMWGAEMGANEAGVVIGNEAVWNRLSDPEVDLQPRLLGMDLLRLGLERGRSASQALDVIVDLLEQHGQGGPCSDIYQDLYYHNSFLIADSEEAWILETAGSLWAAERVTAGCRNISNCMSITTRIDKAHPRLKVEAEDRGWWRPDQPFNWTQVMEGTKEGKICSGNSRFQSGKQLLETRIRKGEVNVGSMMAVLRDEESGICRSYETSRGNPTLGSQVSELSKTDCFHFFTATSDPKHSLFKPVPSFAALKQSQELCSLTKSPASFPAKVKDTVADRRHPLWIAHRSRKMDTKEDDQLQQKLEAMENDLIAMVLNKKDDGKNVFEDAVKAEMKLYNL